VAPAFLGLAQLVVAILLAVLAAYLGIYLFELTTRDIDEWAELRRGNMSVGMVLAAIAVGIALILRPATQVALTGWDVGNRWLPVYVLAREAVQLLVGVILAVAAVALALWLFSRLTGEIDEMAELKKDNRSIGALLVGVVLAVSLLVASAVESLAQVISSFIH
jgi:uncharacterized membrane protein YjfL (UPF0719 family)